MILSRLSVLNYKNLSSVSLTLSPNVNCFVGANGMGKTNVLDAVYYLSFLRSSTTAQDAVNILHGQDFFLLQGDYERADGVTDRVSCGLKAGSRKHVKRNDKDVRRFSEHIGTIPLVMISPSDSLLVSGGSEERRRFMDMVISQYDAAYMESLIRYDKTLRQRNALLRQAGEEGAAVDWSLMDVLEDMLSADGETIFQARKTFVEAFVPIFGRVYASLGNVAAEQVAAEYVSHGFRGPLKPQLESFRQKETIVGYTLHGPHKDDLNLLLNGFPVKREGSQGQIKTYFIAMKLAQFEFLKARSHAGVAGDSLTPILLLDDIFDKLDAERVARIVENVSSERFGQIFITDTNREHLDSLLAATDRDYKLFRVVDGTVTPA